MKRKDTGTKSKGHAECITQWSRDMNHRVISFGRDSLSLDSAKNRVFILMGTPRAGRLKTNSLSKDQKEFYGVCGEILKILGLREN